MEVAQDKRFYKAITNCYLVKSAKTGPIVDTGVENKSDDLFSWMNEKKKMESALVYE